MQQYLARLGLLLVCTSLLCACASSARTRGGERSVARMERVEARLAALHLSTIDAESYALAKARAWYEFAYDAYVQGDRSVMASEALAQSESILQRVEAHGGPVHVQALAGLGRAQRVRDDLWNRLARLEQHRRFTCAQGDVARMYVHLLAASNARYELGWRHARPYIQAAERYATQAQERLEYCGVPPEQAEQTPALPSSVPGRVPGRVDEIAPLIPPQTTPDAQ